MDGIYSIDGLAGGTVSNELQATLSAIAETTDGEKPKFSSAVTRRLTRWIVCRSYSGPIHELCHLIVVASRVTDARGFETFFWCNGGTSASAFRQRIDEGLSQGHASTKILQSQAASTVLYPDGEFSIAHTRMSFLSALLEFMVSTLGYSSVFETIEDILSDDASLGTVSDTANLLSRRLYAYLGTHLPAATAQRKFRAATEFLAARHDNSVLYENIDDEAVLDFWVTKSADDESEGDFKTYKNVVRLFIQVRQALLQARHQSALQQSLSIGYDRENGEIDPSAIDVALEEIHERRAPLDQLNEAPASEIKFLNKSEKGALELLLESGESAQALPLSILRATLFGAIQAQLTQALRRGTDIATIIETSEAPLNNRGYDDCLEDLERLDTHIERVLLASFYHIAMAGDDTAISILMEMRPEMDLSPLAALLPSDKPTPDNVIYLYDQKPASDTTLTIGEICGDSAACPELSAFVSESRKAAKRISRQGFSTPDATVTPNMIVGFVNGAEALLDIRKSLTSFITKISRIADALGQWEERDSQDCEIFFDQYRRIYGVSS
ncbi:MAG: hypothetical protein CMM52_14095 [Rhodospirillaceae bacterium]|nr:hypothetical protein [Rhodospirillaceae bacterium]